MKEPDYISRSEIKDPELEFENLRNTGIEEIQKLSGSTWTDYNIHDPGVTIFEQLCYAITELGYKTNFEIQDLLASQNNLPNVNDTFFTPAQILHGKPITISDFRRILIDRVDGLRDVWIEPLNLRSGGNQIKGTYLVLVKPSPKIIKTDEEIEILKVNTRKCLEKYSNLGEAFDEVVILKEEKIYVTAEIELENEANAALTHAKVLYNIGKYISCPMPFYSLEQMVSKGYSYEQIFTGPRLLNGFILDEDLKDKISTLLASQLINVIYSVDGVSRVKNLEIKKLAEEKEGELVSFTYKLESVHHNQKESDHRGHLESAVMDDGVLIDMNKVAVLANEMMPYNPGYKPNITYFQNQVPVSLFKNNVIRYLRQIESENRVKYFGRYQSKNDSMPDEGAKKPIENYFSVQEHFPAIYALGSRGIPPSFDKSRVAHVKQLKAYLLFFEQILTNYLAQLRNFSNLFSLDENLSQTYFEGSLASVPYINNLVKGLEGVDNTEALDQKTREISFAALQTIDDFNTRRHQVLDHLLARFGERVSNFGIASFNYYYNTDEHLNRMIMSKVDLLKEMVFVSSKRAKSFNALRPFWEDEKPNEEVDDGYNYENISYLKKKTRIRLGIQSKNRKLCGYLQERIGGWKKSGDIKQDELFNHINSNYLVNGNLALHSVTDLSVKDEPFDPEIKISSEILRRGVWPENFKILKETTDNTLYYVAFSAKFSIDSLNETESKEITDKLYKAAQKPKNKQPEFLRFWNRSKKNRHLLIEFKKGSDDRYSPEPNNVWVVINEHESLEKAMEYISSLINYLRDININTEGFYLIDHIELRHRTGHNLYNILINLKNGKTGFESAEQYSYLEMQEALIDLIHQARAARYHHEKTGDKDDEISLVHDEKTIGYFRPLSADQEINMDDVAYNMNKLLDSLTDFDLYDPSVFQFNVAGEKDAQVFSGSFYSFRVSVVIPAWPARFADDEFKKVLESVIREESPAHIGVDFYYLEFGKLKQFEKLYSTWIDDLRLNSFDHQDKVNDSSMKLARFINDLEMEEKEKKLKKLNGVKK